MAMKIINEVDFDEPELEPDFSEWNWGDDHELLVKLFMDRVASVLWGQIKTDMEANWRYPRFTIGRDDDKPAIILWLLESHSLEISLDEIEMPEGEDLEVFDAKWRQRMIDTFKGWIAILEGKE